MLICVEVESPDANIPEVWEAEEEKALSNRELKKDCFLYARENFQGKFYHNADIGCDIVVSRDGLDEWFNKTKSRDQALSIKRLDSLLESGKAIDQSSDNYKRQYVEGFVYLSASCSSNLKFTHEPQGEPR